jgi:alanyl-tRNA synthetase
MPTANDIRQQFLDFFAQKHGHTVVPSSSVVPHDDPTLLFTNAGMNQFKDVFLGTGTRAYRRAVDSQKCIRAGGKHNDLDDVGRDTYHHTFFEMLGNWSFGDYFKKEAIAWAWELLTQVWGLDRGRLHATVFEGAEGLERDQEAFDLWKQVTDIDPRHIHWGSAKDNFWEMGETGPCGPCSEIHIDRTADKSGSKLVNAGRPEVIEIWNLVFIQFNRGPDKKLTPLPARHVDTGMGFERVSAVLQGKASNYDTDVFSPLMDAIGSLVNERYAGRLDDPRDVAFRVIADHLRMLTFAITDGALPGNKGRGAVLRSVLRRAFRFGYQAFGQREPFIHGLVPVVVEHMGTAYPELRKNPARVQDVIRGEEADFLRTIERGLALFENAARKGRVNGEAMFELHTTYGFPPDLTRQMATERGLGVDEEDYQRRLREHEEKSRGKATAAQVALNVGGGLPTTDDRPKWHGPAVAATVLGWIADNQFHTTGRVPEAEVGLILDRTCFYAEQGGQVGDQGTIRTPTGLFEVSQTVKAGNAVVHVGSVSEGRVEVGQEAGLQVSPQRDFTRKNHTATHLLHWALHRVLGEHVEQRGSKVKPDEFTFDFSHTGPLTDAEKAEVERLVNEKVYADLPVAWRELPIAEAKRLPGVKAFFGDKYGDRVRVVEIHDTPLSPLGRGAGGEGPTSPLAPSGRGAGGEGHDEVFSREFCGGTHLEHTGQIGFFKIVSEEAVGKGVRRLTCVTAREAVRAVQKEDSILADLSARFRCQPEELAARVDSLQEEVKKLQQQLRKGAAGDLQGAADKLLAEAGEVHGAKLVIGQMPAGPMEQMRQQADRLRQKAGSAVVVLGWADEGKAQLLAAVTRDLEAKGLHAGNLIKQIARVIGGGGGGPPSLAQAGGKEPGKVGEALQLARKILTEQLAAK